MLTIDNQPATNTIPLLNLGFRPFFLAAALFTVLATIIWSAVYLLGWQITAYGTSAMTWHAHEMIYGYTLAVVAGFLLTAVSNWTNHQTLNDVPLLLLLLTWVAGRVLPLMGDSVPVLWIGIVDNLFLFILIVNIGWLLIKVKQWANLAVISLLLLLLISNIAFYAGVMAVYSQGIHVGLYAGVYIVLALIFVMGRRVIPFFIEKGVGYPVTIRNWMWLDIAVLVLYGLFAVADLFLQSAMVVSILSGILFLLHGVRLFNWYTPGIWKKPLLWILYVGYAFLALGFGLKAAVYLFGLSPYLAMHAFSYGGIGMITIGMMARVALGHTGRSVFEPPAVLFWMFIALFAGTILRVIIPIILPAYYSLWIALAQSLWVISFAMFFFVYAPMLLKARVDGRYG